MRGFYRSPQVRHTQHAACIPVFHVLGWCLSCLTHNHQGRIFRAQSKSCMNDEQRQRSATPDGSTRDTRGQFLQPRRLWSAPGGAAVQPRAPRLQITGGMIGEFLDACLILTLEARQACLLHHISISSCPFCLYLSLKPWIRKNAAMSKTNKQTLSAGRKRLHLVLCSWKYITPALCHQACSTVATPLLGGQKSYFVVVLHHRSQICWSNVQLSVPQ